MKAPGLSETVGGRPMSVFEDFDEKFVSNFPTGIQERRLDGAPRAIGKISRHLRQKFRRQVFRRSGVLEYRSVGEGASEKCPSKVKNSSELQIEYQPIRN